MGSFELTAMMLTITALTICLALLQVADWYTTRTILAKGGYEQNPVSKWLIDELGVDEFLVCKGVAVTIAGLYIGMESEDLLAAVVVIYVVVVYHNLKSMP